MTILLFALSFTALTSSDSSSMVMYTPRLEPSAFTRPLSDPCCPLLVLWPAPFSVGKFWLLLSLFFCWSVKRPVWALLSVRLGRLPLGLVDTSSRWEQWLMDGRSSIDYEPMASKKIWGLPLTICVRNFVLSVSATKKRTEWRRAYGQLFDLRMGSFFILDVVLAAIDWR